MLKWKCVQNNMNETIPRPITMILDKETSDSTKNWENPLFYFLNINSQIFN